MNNEIKTGLDRLDEMLRGGICVSEMITISSSFYTGKSYLEEFQKIGRASRMPPAINVVIQELDVFTVKL